MSSDNNSQDIAIIGMAGRFPGADDITSFWNNLAAGKETLTFLSDAELIDAGVDAALLENPLYINSCGNLEGIELFDAGFFDMSRTEAEITDPQHRLLLETAYTALEDAGYLTEEGGIRIGVYASVGMRTYQCAELGLGHLPAKMFSTRAPPYQTTGWVERVTSNKK